MNRNTRMKEIVNYCNKTDIMVIAWRPYNQKSVSKKTGELLLELAKKYKSTSSQIALFWLTNQSNMVVLDNFETTDEIKDACSIMDLAMSKPDMERLNLVN